MSISITAAPSLFSPAWQPEIFEVTSDRSENVQVSVTGVSLGTAGMARYAVSANQYKIGDVVTGSGFSSASVVYNIRQTVVAISALYFETDFSFVVFATGAGTVTRTNDNFQIRCDVYEFENYKTINSVSDSGGFALLAYTSHDYKDGDLIFVEGTSDYDGTHLIVSVIGTTSVLISTAYTFSRTGVSRKGSYVGSKRQNLIINTLGSSVFRLDASGMLQTVLKPDLIDSRPANLVTPNTSDFPLCNSLKPYCVVFIEEYDDKNGLLTIADRIQSAIKYTVRATLKHNETQSLARFISKTPLVDFLTNCPQTKRIRVGEEEQLKFLTNQNAVVGYKIGYAQFDLGGNIIASGYLGGVTIVDGIGIAPIHSNLINSNMSRLEVAIYDSDEAQYTSTMKFIVDKNNYQNAVRVHFENSLGGFDAYTFTGDYSKQSEIKRTSFKKTLPLAFATRDRGTTDLSISSSITQEVYSDFLSNAEAMWLNELLITSNAFIKNIGETKFTPINIYSDSQVLYSPNQPAQFKLSFSESNDPNSLNN